MPRPRPDAAPAAPAGRTGLRRACLAVVLALLVCVLAFLVHDRLTSVECELQRAFGQADWSCGALVDD